MAISIFQSRLFGNPLAWGCEGNLWCAYSAHCGFPFGHSYTCLAISARKSNACPRSLSSRIVAGDCSPRTIAMAIVQTWDWISSRVGTAKPPAPPSAPSASAVSAGVAGRETPPAEITTNGRSFIAFLLSEGCGRDLTVFPFPLRVLHQPFRWGTAGFLFLKIHKNFLRI